MTADGPADSFAKAVAAAETRAADGAACRGPRIRSVFCFGPSDAAGGAAWRRALDWTAPQEHHRSLGLLRKDHDLRLPAVDEIEINRTFEPGLAASELKNRWLRYLWRNHPDRQPPELRALGTARVAAANARYDSLRRRGLQS